jgi:GDP-D-mannose 3', 5'-epimerase
MTKSLVCGGGGFIGSWLVKRLKADGHWVRAADLKYPDYDESPADEFLITDLREYENCLRVTDGVDFVWQLAALMGGIGFLHNHCAEMARGNVLINAHMLEAARVKKVKKYLYSSSACVYPAGKQNEANLPALKEEDAYPADAEPGYGWEKLYSELLCQYFQKDHNLDTRIVRFHNVYGPLGTYDGGKEKAPAAICRKIAEAQDGDTIEIWGDGEQTRSFMHVDDCCEGLVRLMDSDYRSPLNLGTDELVTVNQLVDKVARVANKEIRKRHNLKKPQGVRGRNSDNTRLREVLGWEPKILLDEGLRPTYDWIERQVYACND